MQSQFWLYPQPQEYWLALVLAAVLVAVLVLQLQPQELEEVVLALYPQPQEFLTQLDIEKSPLENLIIYLFELRSSITYYAARQDMTLFF